jgi:hypothetical protein
MTQQARPSIDPAVEAQRLCRLFEGEPTQLVIFLSGQLSVLKSQAQMIMGLSGLIVTVTGFSGHHMVRGGTASTAAMITGIVFVLLGVMITLRTLGKLRWVTQDLSEDLSMTAQAVILRRDAEQSALGRAGVLVGLGLAAYLVAVVLAALHNGQA